ncbi:hypothetical protein T484DRAFT_1945047, partial [Baffinella frigidus]
MPAPAPWQAPKTREEPRTKKAIAIAVDEVRPSPSRHPAPLSPVATSHAPSQPTALRNPPRGSRAPHP